MTEKKSKAAVKAEAKAAAAPPVPASPKKGIKETKDVLAMVFAIGKLFVQAKKNDGKINAQDLGLLVGAFPVLGPAFDGITEIPAELKDLDVDEVKELLSYSAAHLGDAFDSPELLEKVEKGLKAVLALVDFGKTFVKK